MTNAITKNALKADLQAFYIKNFGEVSTTNSQAIDLFLKAMDKKVDGKATIFPSPLLLYMTWLGQQADIVEERRQEDIEAGERAKD